MTCCPVYMQVSLRACWTKPWTPPSACGMPMVCCQCCATRSALIRQTRAWCATTKSRTSSAPPSPGVLTQVFSFQGVQEAQCRSKTRGVCACVKSLYTQNKSRTSSVPPSPGVCLCQLLHRRQLCYFCLGSRVYCIPRFHPAHATHSIPNCEPSHVQGRTWSCMCMHSST